MIAVFKFLKVRNVDCARSGSVSDYCTKMWAGSLEHWAEALRLDPGNRFVDAALVKASLLRPEQIKRLGLGSFLYAALFLAEGTGLWLRKRWGEWLTVIITSSLIPVEIYEIYRHPSAVKAVVFVINIAIVGYLISQIRSRRAGSE